MQLGSAQVESGNPSVRVHQAKVSEILQPQLSSFQPGHQSEPYQIGHCCLNLT